MWKLERREYWIFATGILLCLIARGSALVSPTFNVDDLWYWPMGFDFNTVGVIGLREGRFTGAFIAGLDTALGVNAPLSFTLAGAAMIVCQVITALLICRLWKIDDDKLASVVAVALLVLHPYWADLFTWKIALLNGGLPFVATFVALAICTLGRKAAAVAVLLIVLALGVHQLPLQLASAALALAVPIGLVRRNFVLREWVFRVATLVVATIAYVIVAKLSVALLSNIDSVGRDKLIIHSHFALVIARAQELLELVAIKDPLTGWLTRVIFVLLTLFSAGRILIARETSLQRRAIESAALVGALAAAFVCAIALTIVPHAWMPAFRNLLSIGALWAAVAVIALSLSTGVARKIVTVSIALVVFGFLGSNNQVLSDQQRANRRDVALMTRVAAAVGALDKATPMKKISFVGTNTSSLKNIATAANFSHGWHEYGTTLSTFAVMWPGYLLQLYNEVTGEDVRDMPTAPEQAWAVEQCKGRQWPEKAAVFGRGDMVVVCLGPVVPLFNGRFNVPAAPQQQDANASPNEKAPQP